jgi:hypothetical protein
VWLAIDFLTLPATSGVKRLLTSAFDSLVQRARSGPHSYTETAWIVQRGGLLELSSDFEKDEPAYVGTVMANPSCRRAGWWAPTHEAFRANVVSFFEVELTDEQLQQVRDLFATHLASQPLEHMTEYAQWVREGRTHVARSLPWGYVRNSVAITMAFILLIACLDWMLSRLLRWRDGRVMRRGCCPKCGYLLRYEFSAGCPECGWRREVRPSV